jgi:hypothetical protein
MPGAIIVIIITVVTIVVLSSIIVIVPFLTRHWQELQVTINGPGLVLVLVLVVAVAWQDLRSSSQCTI